MQGEGEMKMANRLQAPWPDAVAPGDTHLMIGGEHGCRMATSCMIHIAKQCVSQGNDGEQLYEG